MDSERHDLPASIDRLVFEHAISRSEGRHWSPLLQGWDHRQGVSISNNFFFGFFPSFLLRGHGMATFEPVLKSRALGWYSYLGGWNDELLCTYNIYFLHSALPHLSGINKLETMLWTTGRSEVWIGRVYIAWTTFWFAALLYIYTLIILGDVVVERVALTGAVIEVGDSRAYLG